MSRFYCQWFGNKRLELKHLDEIPGYCPEDFTDFVEPFCGSAAWSLDLHARGLGEGRGFHVNDADPGLVNFMRHVAAEGSAGVFEWAAERRDVESWRAVQEMDETESPHAWFYQRYMLGGFARKGRAPDRWKKCERSAKQIGSDAFYATADITHGDWLECVERFKDSPQACVFLDPPYFSSFNVEYFGGEARYDDDGFARDNTAVYVDIKRFMEECTCAVVLITNSNSVMRELYRPWIVKEYGKKYATPHKKEDGSFVKKATNHILCWKAPG